MSTLNQPNRAFRPRFNLGGLFDIPTCRWRRGMKGEMIKDAGRAGLMGLSGQGFMFKSIVACWIDMRTVDRYSWPYRSIIYDTEITLNRTRLNEVTKGSNMDMSQHTHPFSPTVILIDAAKMDGDEFITNAATMNQMPSASDDLQIETPFRMANGEALRVYPPVGITIDSLSMIKPAHEPSDGWFNTNEMRFGLLKSKFLEHTSRPQGTDNTYLLMTAHLGKPLNLDPNVPEKDIDYKNVPTQYRYLPDIDWLITHNDRFTNSETGEPEHPNRPDLRRLTLISTRNKQGPADYKIKLIVSPQDGVLPELSQYHYCKEDTDFGINRIGDNFAMKLYPECTLTEETLIDKINEDPKLRRAIELTSDLLQLVDTPSSSLFYLWCQPETLYDDIKQLGYDWDRLLESRDYWTFDQYTHPVPFLTIYDLLEVRKGLKSLYWYPNPKCVSVSGSPDSN